MRLAFLTNRLGGGPQSWGAAILLLLACLWGAGMLLACVEPLWDESNQLAQAWRVAQGDRLYQEVWEFAGPLPLLGMAAVYHLTGPSLDLARLLATGLLFTMVGGVVYLARRAGASWPLAALVGALLPLGLVPAYRAFYHHWVAWAFVLMGWCLTLGSGASLPKHPHWRQLLSGLCLGAATLSTLTVGLVGVLTVPLAYLLALGPAALTARQRPLALAWAVGLLLPWGAVLLYFAQEGGLMAFFRQSFWWPMVHYKQPGGLNDVWPLSDLATSIPFDGTPGRAWRWLGSTLARLGVASLHLLGFALACLHLLRMATHVWKRPALQEGGATSDLAWALLAWGAFLTALMLWHGRGDLTHLAMGAVPALPLLGASLGLVWRVAEAARAREPWALWVGAFPVALVVALVGLCAFAELRQAASQASLGQLSWGLDRRFKQSEWVRVVNQHLAPGDRALGFPQHGLLFLFTQAKPATRFGYLSGRTQGYNGPAEYEAFAADWRAHPPDLVLLVGHTPDQAAAAWGRGEPNLKGYRLVGRPGGLGGAAIYRRQAPAKVPDAP